MPYPFTLHIRLTHACNAACSYCSSWQRDPDQRMSVDELRQCLDGVERFWELARLSPTHLNVEYVGGEILLVPPGELRAMVELVRSRFSPRMVVRDGAQSNLIGSATRVDELLDLFEHRVGTSVDHFSNQRQLGRAADASQRARRYRTFFLSTSSRLERQRGVHVPAVLTVDRLTLPHLGREITLAIESDRDLTIRPVFQGGSEIDGLSPVAFGEALVAGFQAWQAAAMRTRIEPFVSLLRRRLDPDRQSSFCAWQRDCAVKSLSIEPNGDCYICQELADMDTYRLGNLIRQDFDLTLHRQLTRRTAMLEKGCFECPYFSSCQGGCMQQSVEAGTGMYGKTQWCTAWKMLFAAMDDHISQESRRALKSRLDALHPEFAS